MKALDVERVAEDIDKAAKKYIERLSMNRFTPVIRQWFTDAMSVSPGTIEILEPTDASIHVDSRKYSNALVDVIGGEKVLLERICTDPERCDVDDLCVPPGQSESAFTRAVRRSTEDYAAMSRGCTFATVPTLYVKIEGFGVNWFLWGYIGAAK